MKRPRVSYSSEASANSTFSIPFRQFFGDLPYDLNSRSRPGTMPGAPAKADDTAGAGTNTTGISDGQASNSHSQVQTDDASKRVAQLRSDAADADAEFDALFGSHTSQPRKPPSSSQTTSPDRVAHALEKELSPAGKYKIEAQRRQKQYIRAKRKREELYTAKPPPADIVNAGDACKHCSRRALVLNHQKGQLTCRGCGYVAELDATIPDRNILGFDEDTRTRALPQDPIAELFEQYYARAKHAAITKKAKRVNQKQVMKKLSSLSHKLVEVCGKARLKTVVLASAREIFGLSLSGRRPASATKDKDEQHRQRVAAEQLRRTVLRFPSEACAAILWFTCRLSRTHCRSLKFICARNNITNTKRVQDIYKLLTLSFNVYPRRFSVLDFIERYGQLLMLPTAVIAFAKELYKRLHPAVASDRQSDTLVDDTTPTPSHGDDVAPGVSSKVKKQWAPTSTAAGYVYFAGKCDSSPSHCAQLAPIALGSLSPSSRSPRHSPKRQSSMLTASAVANQTCVAAPLILDVYRHVAPHARTLFSLDEWVAWGKLNISLHHIK